MNICILTIENQYTIIISHLPTYLLLNKTNDTSNRITSRLLNNIIHIRTVLHSNQQNQDGEVEINIQIILIQSLPRIVRKPRMLMLQTQTRQQQLLRMMMMNNLQLITRREEIRLRNDHDV